MKNEGGAQVLKEDTGAVSLVLRLEGCRPLKEDEESRIRAILAFALSDAAGTLQGYGIVDHYLTHDETEEVTRAL